MGRAVGGAHRRAAAVALSPPCYRRGVRRSTRRGVSGGRARAAAASVAAYCAMFAAVLSGWGCGRPDDQPSARIPVQLEAIDGPGVGTRARAGAWVGRAVEDALAESEALAVVDGSEDAGHLRLAYREIRSDYGAVLRLQVDVEVPPQFSARVPGGLDAAVELEREDGTLQLDRDFPVALERAVAVLDAKIALGSNDEKRVLALLGDDDPELVLLALEHVTRRGMRNAIDRVLPLLKHPDLRVARAVVECVGLIGGPEHVGPLLATAKLSDRAHTGRLYDALANLGGDEALGFLEFAARNEDDPALAELARRSLERAQTARPRPTERPRTVARGHR